MLSDVGIALSLLALGAMAAPAPQPAQRTIEVPLCNGGSHRIPIDGGRRNGRHDCPGACHMLSGRRRHLATGCGTGP